MLEIRNLSKSYGEKKAVCNLNLIVEDGDIMGFIGKNGAGKQKKERQRKNTRKWSFDRLIFLPLLIAFYITPSS